MENWKKWSNFPFCVDRGSGCSRLSLDMTSWHRDSIGMYMTSWHSDTVIADKRVFFLSFILYFFPFSSFVPPSIQLFCRSLFIQLGFFLCFLSLTFFSEPVSKKFIHLFSFFLLAFCPTLWTFQSFDLFLRSSFSLLPHFSNVFCLVLRKYYAITTILIPTMWS